ncbi:ribosome maturation factor RimM [Alkalicoccus daliensis]|uniref:Ribosome maturation factor RimM n=1 Tax=Alkalicoccus daliensis TaxID=745820 RepID=A0A1H0A098_9BACI|nr:ribosome maturation factor RimM [Alkalicoccus daliensis]SDN27252.1 16S rRNA processing protein RimM [Alkalicoccus daliensis]
MSDWLNVGKIVNTHGIRGEVRVISRTDFPELRFAEGSKLTVFQEGKSSETVIVASWRQHKQFDLLTFEKVENVNEAEKFKGSLLKIHRDQLHENELETGEYYFHEIVGLTVFTDQGEKIGTVKEILTPGANDVWVIHAEDSKKEVLIPYIEEVVKEIDLKENKVIITPMEGLLDL